VTKKYPQYIIDKAIEFRIKDKLTVPEIAERMGIAKATVNKWMKDYPLEERTKKQTEAQKQAAEENRERAAEKRQDAYNEMWELAPELLKDYNLYAFVCMYIGEGTKKRRNEVAICNSDADVMRLSHKWIVALKHPERVMDYSLQIHADQNEDEIKAYWAEQLGINPELIKTIRKSNSNQLKGRKFNSLYGVLTVRANDTYFRARLQALIDYTKASW
jgi:transcriptional regulator with XRE-family HTH domain